MTYHPTVPGEYLVDVKFNQKPVPGAPFKPKITSKVDVSGIKIEGLDPGEKDPLVLAASLKSVNLMPLLTGRL